MKPSAPDDKKQIVLYYFGDSYGSPFPINKMTREERDRGILTP